MEPERCPNCGERLDEPTYFNSFSGVTGNHIIVGGRIIGKTELLVRRACELLADGKDVEILTPRMAMAREMKDRIVKQFGVNNLSHSSTDFVKSECGGSIHFSLTEQLHGFDRSTAKAVDAVLVDEAQEVPQSVWLSLDRCSDEIPLLVFAGTPTPTQTILSGFAEYNTKYETWHIPTDSGYTAVTDEKIGQQYDYMGWETFNAKIRAKYWTGDEPIIQPDHDYS